jgi:PRTRC genetic system protein A
MNANLAAIFASLSQHHIATPAEALPLARSGITWIWAANGIWKRGVDAQRDILICVQPTRPTPGLAQLVPHVRHLAIFDRIPGGLLTALLDHARCAGDGHAIARPIEQQYFMTYRTGLPQPFRLAVPDQDASALRVSYQMPRRGQLLIDVHSHHRMAAYFSTTDDHDDRGLSVSAVVGNIFDRPEITIRANVYGHRCRIPALSVFDHLPTPLREVPLSKRKDDHANADD